MSIASLFSYVSPTPIRLHVARFFVEVVDLDLETMLLDRNDETPSMSTPVSPMSETTESQPSLASPRLSVLMPVYNEEETVEAIIADVLAVPIDLELIVVDDGSTDATRSLLGKIEAVSDPRLKIIYAPYNVGKGAAIRVALSHASGEVIVIQDADREYDPMDFVAMLDRIDRGAAVVYGTRLSAEAMSLNNEGRHDKFYYARRVLPFLTNAIFGTRLTDEATCYKMFRREVLISIPLRCERFDFCPEVTAKIARRGYKIYEVPIHYNARTAAEGKKIGWSDAFDAVAALVKFRFRD